MFSMLDDATLSRAGIRIGTSGTVLVRSSRPEPLYGTVRVVFWLGIGGAAAARFGDLRYAALGHT
jgi:hypothetical protein